VVTSGCPGVGCCHLGGDELVDNPGQDAALALVNQVAVGRRLAVTSSAGTPPLP